MVYILTNGSAEQFMKDGKPVYVHPEENVKKAVKYAVELANELSNLGSRGHALDILEKVFPDIYSELRRE